MADAQTNDDQAPTPEEPLDAGNDDGYINGLFLEGDKYPDGSPESIAICERILNYIFLGVREG